MTGVEQIVKDTTLTFEQKVVALARYAENSVQVLNISEETQALRDAGIICDLFEGNVPYRPRYILPNYEKLMKEGMRYFSLYSSDADVIRITGYLVKRSEIAKLDQGIATLQDTVVLGQGQVRNGKVYERKVR